ncbi:MAG TPA: cell division protein FtsZ [Candidatus Rifleibacterium sp.]|nr:cell division protein FtsZ [Candidatus Rifleibacterium sp.]
MIMKYDFNLDSRCPVFKIIGVGKGGISTVNHLIATTKMSSLEGVEFITVSTVTSETLPSNAKTHILLEEQSTGWVETPEKNISEPGLCENDRRVISENIRNADMVVIISTLGCAITTAGALFVAEVAKELEIFTVGLVSSPFAFEGRSRVKNAAAGAIALEQRTDSIIVIHNDKLIDQALMGKEPVSEAYRRVEEALGLALKGPIGLVATPSLICIDIFDVKTILSGGTQASFSFGVGRGDNRAEEAVQMALTSQLLDGCDLKECKGILISIFCDRRLETAEINSICDLIQKEVSDDANIIYGHVIDDQLENETEKGLLKVTIIASRRSLTDEDKI